MTSRRNSAPLRLLIADVDAAFRADLREMVEAFCYQVVTEASTGREVLEAARRFCPDVILLSLNTTEGEASDFDYFTVAANLQREKIAPVLLVASQVNPETVRKAAAIGIYSFLVKPLRQASLLPAIEIAYGNWRDRLEAERRLKLLQKQDNTRALVDCAKKTLMQTVGLSEAEAYRLIRTRSMNTRKSMEEIALAILTAYPMLNSGRSSVEENEIQIGGSPR